MLYKKLNDEKNQLVMTTIEELVPQDHILRDIENAIDFSFIYELVKEKYSQNTGRPSLDPVMLIKIPMIQYLFGIKSMRQTVKEIQVNVAYRWFLGLGLIDSVPHFTTFGKNYTRRFKDTDLFEQIFNRILEEIITLNLVDTDTIFVDATHIKAAANKKKNIKKNVKKETMFYEKKLKEEINKDREIHGKKPFEDKNDDDNSNGTDTALKDKNIKTITESTTDPESGLFHKGEHKEVFAYCSETACDKNGWILRYTVHPGNLHDSRTFPKLFNKLIELNPKMIVADAGYKTPQIAKLIMDEGIQALLPYKRPMTKPKFFKKYEYVYDEYYNCYVCPNNQILKYCTTTRDGYREYKSNAKTCCKCPFLKQCTASKNNTKVIARHIWQEYIEKCEDIRHTKGNKQIYNLRKETIERIFGTAKENHGLRYTTEVGIAQMKKKIGLTFACMNLKKLAKFKKKMGLISPFKTFIFKKIFNFIEIHKFNYNKRNLILI